MANKYPTYGAPKTRPRTQPVYTAAPRSYPRYGAQNSAVADAETVTAPPRYPRYGPRDETDQQFGDTTAHERASLMHPNGRGVESDRPPAGFVQVTQDLQTLLTSPVEDKNGRVRSGGIGGSKLRGAAHSRAASA